MLYNKPPAHLSVHIRLYGCVIVRIKAVQIHIVVDVVPHPMVLFYVPLETLHVKQSITEHYDPNEIVAPWPVINHTSQNSITAMEILVHNLRKDTLTDFVLQTTTCILYTIRSSHGSPCDQTRGWGCCR